MTQSFVSTCTCVRWRSTCHLALSRNPEG